MSGEALMLNFLHGNYFSRKKLSCRSILRLNGGTDEVTFVHIDVMLYFYILLHCVIDLGGYNAI
jgi:hypothetical protein